MVGQNIGKYRVLDRVGRGGMGTVYRAIDETLHREVAIKVLNAELNDPEVAKRFRAEAITVARLSHPGIATIYELFQHDGQWLMVMEFVRGETLEGLVTRGGAQTPNRAAELCIQSLAALAHAHSMGVVHRDLKPANIMLTEAGDIKIMDFGIARVTGAEHLTNVGFMMGTPAYMAPEQVLGQDIDARSDLYAMGVVFFRLLTAELPFKGDTPFAMAQAQVNSAPVPISKLRQDLPPWVEEMITRSLAKKPDERFQSAVEFHDRLQRSLSGDPALETYMSSAPTGLMTPPRAMPSGAIELTALSTPLPSGDIGAGPASSAVPFDSSAMEQTVATVTPITTARPNFAPAPAPSSPLPAVAPAAPAGAGALPGSSTAPAVNSTTGKPAATASSQKTMPMGLIAAAAGLVAVLAGGAYFVFSRGGAPAPAAGLPPVVEATVETPAVPPPVIPAEPLVAAPVTAAPAPGPAPIATAAATAPVTNGAIAPSGGRSGAVTAPAGRAGTTGVAPVAGATAMVAVDTFPPTQIPNIKVLIVDGRRTQDEDVSLNFSNGHVSVLSQRASTTIATMPYQGVTSATYIHARDPRWDPALPSPPDNLDVGGFLRTSKHWLTLQTPDAYFVFRLEDANVLRVIQEVEARSGITVKRPRGDDSN